MAASEPSPNASTSRPTTSKDSSTSAREAEIGLTVVGPEDPLSIGIVDRFQQAGLRVFGPNKAAAEIESSKAFARELCRRHKIPGPGFWVFEKASMALAFLENRPEGPIVVKASGLAAGKGVVVAKNLDEGARRRALLHGAAHVRRRGPDRGDRGDARGVASCR